MVLLLDIDEVLKIFVYVNYKEEERKYILYEDNKVIIINNVNLYLYEND